MTVEQQSSRTDKTPLQRKRKINAENKRLMSLFENADPNRIDFIRNQVQQLAWLNVNIAELQEKINQVRTLVEYDNGGGQSGIRTNPDVKTLTDYQKLSNAIIRNLLPLVPSQGKRSFTVALGEMLSNV